MLHHRDGGRFPPGVMLGIQAKKFNLSFVKPENLVSHGLRNVNMPCILLFSLVIIVLVYVPFGKLQAGCHVPFTEEWLVWPLYNQGLIGGVL